jgi:hypothetical protein
MGQSKQRTEQQEQLMDVQYNVLLQQQFMNMESREPLVHNTETNMR